MSGETVFEEIYLFVIGHVMNDYASVLAVYKRPRRGRRLEALRDIEAGQIENHWIKGTQPATVDEIDMTFSTDKNCLAFVLIAGDQRPAEKIKSNKLHPAYTYFGKKKAQELSITGKLNCKIVTDAERHRLPGHQHPILCSFQVNIADVKNELRQSSNGGTMSSFPIVFDFVDSDDGRSPVFKRPSVTSSRRRKPTEFLLVPSILSTLSHGGIHPRGGSSMILLA